MRNWDDKFIIMMMSTPLDPEWPAIKLVRMARNMLIALEAYYSKATL